MNKVWDTLTVESVASLVTSRAVAAAMPIDSSLQVPLVWLLVAFAVRVPRGLAGPRGLTYQHDAAVPVPEMVLVPLWFRLRAPHCVSLVA